MQIELKTNKQVHTMYDFHDFTTDIFVCKSIIFCIHIQNTLLNNVLHAYRQGPWNDFYPSCTQNSHMTILIYKLEYQSQTYVEVGINSIS